MSVVNLIGVGKDRAVTREQLCLMTGLPDRTVRRMIAEARALGELIINDQDGEGYYISEDEDDLKRQLRLNTARACSIFNQNKAICRKLREIESQNQVTMEG